MYAHHTDSDEWEEVPYRDSLWTDDGRTTGVVSSSEDFYNIIQYGEILETVGEAAEQHGLDVDGQVSISPTAHKMSSDIDFGTEVYANQDDPINLGLKIQSGHSGFHALKYDVGAERQVCSNGMVAFHSDLHFEQSHNDAFRPGLAYNAVDAIVKSPAEIEHRLAQAQNRELMNQDEALLVLLDTGIDRYLEDPVPDLLNAMHNEVDDPENPTLWETYNAGTRALTHYSQDVPDYDLATGFEQVSQLLETGANQLPDPEVLGQSTVSNRSRQLIEHGNAEPYWDGERESLRELMQEHEITV
ncbi:DUF932 domain-containing protein [Haloarcula marismortui ATCC 33800]|uniref:DUF932 domain-containing protein n=1 Tax=Haloarcula marismortui ATCC 33800 TaxID=662476 RepID=M0K332_9EURY|nr:DUF932 domain-containing protein [Haloarcula sinaiiensis]EMA15203.1 hypothetical protein C436_05465 [Haloarcula sinaiiensis ATCC 33800]QUJ71942.1 DUF932 domain-containing protein [Haloarcula sinaiiensis ATCC 33800]